MKVLVVYASRSGNTERVARAVAEGLRPDNDVHVLSADAAADQRGADYDLLVVGAPTQIHALRLMGIRGFLRTARVNGFGTLPVAAFDTRFRGDPWETGSAAGVIARHLEHDGARLVADPMSFFIDAITRQLALGEEDRAREWGTSLASTLIPA